MEKLVENFLNQTHLREIATVCKKTDGFGIIIEVYSEDHGELGNEGNPAHAHLKNSSGEYLGKFAITKEPPQDLHYVFDVDKKIDISSNDKKIISEWAKLKNEEDILNWSSLKIAWRVLHP
jgi:hypothetical protein